MDVTQKALDFPGSDVAAGWLDSLGGALDLYGQYRDIERADSAAEPIQPRPEAVADQTTAQTNAGQSDPAPSFLGNVTPVQAAGGVVALIAIGLLAYAATR